MTKKPRQHSLPRLSPFVRLALLLSFIALTVSAAPGAFAQRNSGPVPDNARKASYGDRWECNAGFQAKDGLCVPVVVPAGAYPTNKSYGKGWHCQRGYTEVNRETCVMIAVPQNAHLSASGSTWLCARGYRRKQDICVKVDVPPHAFLSERSYGTGWECDRGYHAAGNICEKIAVPANGYLSEGRSGPGWKCERGFRQTASTCEAIAIPENGYFSEQSFGPGWKCERGFMASGDACIPVTLPANAHLDHSGNRWDCDSPYQRRAEKCVLTN